MAFAERGLSIGRVFPRTHVAEKPRLYSQKEINSMILTTPPDLETKRRVDTPIGTWHMDGEVAIFDSKPTEEVESITKSTVKQRLSTIAKVVLQMS